MLKSKISKALYSKPIGREATNCAKTMLPEARARSDEGECVCVIPDGQTIITASVGHIYNQMCHSFDKLEVVVACFEYTARDDAADKRSRRLSVPPLV